MNWHRAKHLDGYEDESGRFFIYHYSSYYLSLSGEHYWQLHDNDVFVEEFKLLRDAKVAAERLYSHREEN